MADRLTYLETCAQRGEFVQAIREAEALLLLPDLSPLERGRALRIAGRARAETGDPYGGLKLLEMSIPCFFRARAWDRLGFARAEAGFATHMIGDAQQAIDYLQAFLLDAHRYRAATAYTGHVHYHLGLAHQLRRDSDRAIFHYERAADWFTQRGMTLQAGETHQNLSWLYCLAGRYEEAERELIISETFAEVCGPEFRVQLLLGRALHAQRTLRPGLAMSLVQEVMTPGRAGSKPLHKGHAAWIAGVVALDLGDLDNAEYFAALATDYALAAKEPSVMSNVSTLRTEIQRRRNNSGEAAV